MKKRNSLSLILVSISLMLACGPYVTPELELSSTPILELERDNFRIQDVPPDGEEYFLDIRKETIPQDLKHDDCVDLSAYALEMTFKGGDGKDAQLFFKAPPRFEKNYYAFPLKEITSEEPIRFDPQADECNPCDIQDFTCISGVGAKIWGGAQDVEIISAHLVKRDGR